MEVYIENLQEKIPVDDEMLDLIKKAAFKSLEKENFDIPSEVCIMLVDDAQIREINNEQRRIDKPTDVLSFPMVDMVNGTIKSMEGDMDMDENLLLLGDIIISMETAEWQAREYGHTIKREIAFLTTHGMYHLLGYDHQEETQERLMIKKQEAVLSEMGLTRNEE